MDFLNAHGFLIVTVIKVALIMFIVLTVNAYLTWFERKVVAHIQSRWGPHRVGPHGLLQPARRRPEIFVQGRSDAAGVDRFVYYLAPLLALALALTSIAIIPFGPVPCPGRFSGRTFILDSAAQTSISGSWRFSPSPRSACTASRWPAGPPTASIRCSAACAAPRR